MYHHILVAIDLDKPESWSGALPAAVAFSRCFSARITVCSVVSGTDAAVEAQWSTIAYRGMLDLAKVRLAKVASGAGMEVDVEVGTGNVCSGILAVARRVHADLILLASHDPNLTDHLWAAEAIRVARRANCSVLIVRNAGYGAL